MCRIMFQPVGEPSKMKELPGNKSIPRYFVDLFFLPWCVNAFANKKYNEKEIIDAIENEIKRLDKLKLETRKGASKKVRLASVASSDIKCVAKGCKYTGINSNNKSAVGVCGKCGSFEHFECSKTKQEDRDEILKGKQEYFCSICFTNNPSMIAFNVKRFISMKDCNPPPASGNILQLTSTTKATPIPSPVIPVVKFSCINCNFVTETNDELADHERETHSFECQICGKICVSKLEKESHEMKEHDSTNHLCNKCDKSLKTQLELEEHIEKEHSTVITYLCTVCGKSFETQPELVRHSEKEHSPASPHACTLCDNSYNKKEELEGHIEIEHTTKITYTCDVCNINFKSEMSMIPTWKLITPQSAHFVT
jgi:hypothetical protein